MKFAFVFLLKILLYKSIFNTMHSRFADPALDEYANRAQ